LGTLRINRHRLFWAWESNRTYQVQSTTNLLPPASTNWSDVGGLIDAPIHQKAIPLSATNESLFRVTLPWPP